MTIASGTYSTYQSTRLREEFRDAIYMISPEEVPAWSLFPHENVDSKHPEWSTDTLATPVTSNQVLEGDEYSYSAILPTTRLGNYTEIARKTYIISRTDEIVSKAGPKSELGRERRKKGLELKQDMELAILANKASVAGTDVAIRQSAGFAAWIKTNDQRDAGGSDGGFSAGVVAAATNSASKRAFTKAQLDAAILAAYTSGGSPTVLMVSPYIKTIFSGFINVSDGRTAVIQTNIRGKEQATIYAAADTYASDFGVIDVMPNRQLARGGILLTRNAYLIDLSKVAIGILDDVFEDKPAKTGDAEKRAILCEYTLIMKNEAAHSVIADLNGMTVST
jgi:hypothetical protein